jgi:pimeloyl-ACP methyl ester carboxylesterase
MVLLHPATGSGKIWRYQQQAFVDAGFRVIGYSARGADGSDAGQPGDKTSATDDLRAVLAHLDVKRCHLVSTAAGAFTAVDFAHASPEMLESVTFANSMLGVSGTELDPMLKGLQMSALATLPVEMRELGPAYRAGNPAGTERWIEYTHGSSSVRARAGSSQPGSVSGGPGSAPAGREAAPPAPSNRLTLEDLRSIRTPTLLIAGDADMLAPPPLVARFASYLPNCRMMRLPASGHSGYWETPDLFNETVLSFIKSVGKRGRA